MKYPSFLISLLLIAFVACRPTVENEEAQATTPTAIPVQIAPVIQTATPLPITGSGLVAAEEETRMSFKIGGIVQQITVKEGMNIRKGQLLARLDLAEIDAQVSQAQSALSKSQRDLQRAQRLYEDTVITLEQVQNLQTAEEVAAAQVRIAAFNRKQAVIYAPFSGRVLQKMAEEGEMVGAGSPVLILGSDQQQPVLRLGLADVDVVKVALNDPAEVRFDAYPGKTFPAKISEIAAAAEGRTGTYSIELRLDTQGQLLKNGFVGKAIIYPTQQPQYMRIPMNALVEADRDRALVYVPDSAGTQALPVEIRQFQIGKEGIISPLSPDVKLDYVITEGTRYVYPHAPIQIVNSPDMAQTETK